MVYTQQAEGTIFGVLNEQLYIIIKYFQDPHNNSKMLEHKTLCDRRHG